MVLALSGEHMPKEALSARTRTESSSGVGTVAASLAAIGSVLAASSCCLPLFPLMMAAGLAGTSAFLTEVRPYLLVGSILFMAFGFYRAWRARKCNRRTSTVASVLLWVSAAFVLISILLHAASSQAKMPSPCP